MTYFAQIPNFFYDLTGNPSNNLVVVKNVFFRLKILDALQTNSLIYYEYFWQEGDTLEIIAYRYYGDIDKYWVVGLANQIVDPQWDVPLGYDTFPNYIINKYGSIANAQETIQGYNLTISRRDSNTGLVSDTVIIIDLDTYNITPAFTFQELNLVDGTTVAITTTTQIIYAWDFEYKLNEKKKIIKILDKIYLEEISSEFDDLTLVARNRR